MPMLGDESELHRASLAKNAAAFFRMSRSARSLAFSLRSRSISSCSGFSWPWPGKACIGSALSSFAQRRSMFSSISRSRAACATLTPRSRISRTASTLNSRANTRLPMGHLQLQQSPFLGVHETGSRPTSFLNRLGDAGINEQHVERAAVETLVQRTNAGLIRDVRGLLLQTGREARLKVIKGSGLAANGADDVPIAAAELLDER